MKLVVEHHTYFRYTHPVREQTGEARLQPRDDSGQRLFDFKLMIDPQASTHSLPDRFGNITHVYSLLPWHVHLTVSGISVVDTSPSPLSPAPALTLLQRHDYLAASRYVPHTWELAQFAQSRVVGAGDEERARSLMAAIYETCEYVPGSTDISTTADEVLAGKRGVCQDFAHLLIAVCRILGLPARYVSGYLHDPTKPADAILASHAWAEVYLDGQGWLALDPTHNQATNENYIRVAIGRDYADATPVRGLFKGDAQESLDVEVRIRPLPEPMTTT